jgi:hypothetical protein
MAERHLHWQNPDGSVGNHPIADDDEFDEEKRTTEQSKK